MIDSIGVPLPATIDALLILIAAKAPRQAYFAASLAVLGSLAGNLALFQTARYGRRRIMRASEPDKPRKLSAWLRRYGLITVFIPAATPIVPLPLKVFVISAGALRTPLLKFVGVILAGRVLRYFGEAYLGATLGTRAHGFLQHNKWTLLTIPLAVAALSYLLIQLISRRNRPSPTESVQSASS
jgi:membrane protein YqaA with SNARE-associated domain